MAGPRAAERPPYKDLHESYNMSGWHHPGFSVDSVDDVVDELKRRDLTIASEPHDVPSLGLRVAFFADPWGKSFRGYSDHYPIALTGNSPNLSI